MGKIMISTYVMTDSEYGKKQFADQSFVSIITNETIHYVPITIEPGIGQIKLVDQVDIEVPYWIDKIVSGWEFKPHHISLWADGEHDYFAAKYLRINHEQPFVKEMSNIEKYQLAMDLELERFGHELVKLWKRLPRINKKMVRVNPDELYHYDSLEDDTHMGSFFGIENRD